MKLVPHQSGAIFQVFQVYSLCVCVTSGGCSRTRRTPRSLGRSRVYPQKAGHSGKETGARKTESQQIQNFGRETLIRFIYTSSWWMGNVFQDHRLHWRWSRGRRWTRSLDILGRSRSLLISLVKLWWRHSKWYYAKPILVKMFSSCRTFTIIFL